ncbi:MBL fold metallo-hydrolase [Yoonia sp.]|uniref:MBL fold metallo-hydrolase n=1 Tax=Yoonia sp. TaxID=2212373 RepID=UPI0025CE59AB|nr:MBL fold metallo-hydrolase [Yoonia sp.]
MPQVPEFAPQPGAPLRLAPGVTLVLAPNPSPMTCLGTNTYLVGHQTLAVIDPGPDDPAHLAALMAAIAGRHVSHILLTHSHLDHSPLARPLAAATGAPIYAFGDSNAGRSDVMRALADQGLTGGGEGMDQAFAPDVVLADGAQIIGADWQLTALHTPGHIGNHLCFCWNDIVFTGDHVMGWASSLVSPPDGDLGDFMRSCARLEMIGGRVFYPGHGAPIHDPAARLHWLIAHRNTRESQIIAALSATSETIPALTRAIYVDIAPSLMPAAERNVFAHLIELHQRGVVKADPTLGLTAQFRLPAPA